MRSCVSPLGFFFDFPRDHLSSISVSMVLSERFAFSKLEHVRCLAYRALGTIKFRTSKAYVKFLLAFGGYSRLTIYSHIIFIFIISYFNHVSYTNVTLCRYYWLFACSFCRIPPLYPFTLMVPVSLKEIFVLFNIKLRERIFRFISEIVCIFSVPIIDNPYYCFFSCLKILKKILLWISLNK